MYTWKCDGCGKPVAAGKGYIEVDAGAAMKSMEESKAHSAELHLRFAGRPMPASEIIIPTIVLWQVYHAACDPDPDEEGSHYYYHFDVGRCRTLAELLHWNAHLHGKVWLDYTNWDRFIEARRK